MDLRNATLPALALAVALTAGCAPAAAAAPPAIANVAVVERTPHKVVFTASIDPGGLATTAQLEFGATPSLGARSTVANLGGGNEPILATFTLNGEPRRAYYWRFTATNDAGTATSEVQRVETPAQTRRRVVPVVRLSFAVETQPSGALLGRLLGATRPGGLPAGTRVSIRCRIACSGGRSLRITARSTPGALLRFRPAIAIRRRSVVEIRAVRAGYVGRVRRYVFRRSGGLLVPRRVSSRCLTAAPPRRPVACPSG